MIGLATDSPQFCFDRDELAMTDFNVDAFVVKYKREVGLERLRDDLDLFLRVLKSSMVELINRDFADFLNLSTNLVGFDKSITTLKNPLTAMKTDILKINEHLQNQRKLIEEKLAEQEKVRQRRQTIQSIIDIEKSIRQLNELDDAINLSTIDLNEMIERTTVQFGFIAQQLEKSGRNENIQNVIENLRRVFEKRLTKTFIDAYREPNMSLLADSLKGLASISLQTIAEETFATEIVRPFMEKVVHPAIVQSSDLSLGLEKTLDFSRTECKAMLYVVERINRECGSHFDFVVRSIIPELIQCLENSCQFLFFAADPDIFHQRYSSWLNFLDQFKRLLSKSSEENLFQSKIYREFAQKWDLIVYFQIRFQSIVIGIEQTLIDQPFSFNDEKESQWKTKIIERIFQSIEKCWDEKIFLEPLTHQFWKLTLQCLIRLRTWIETFQLSTKIKTNETNFDVCLYVDLQTLNVEVEKFYERVILGQRLTSIVSSNVRTNLSTIFQTTLNDVVGKSREILKKFIIQRLIDQCQESIQSVRDIPRMYRKTNRDAPSKPSACIVTTFGILEKFNDEYNGILLTQDECREFLRVALESITTNYYEMCSEVLSSVKKMEESIRRLKQTRESSKNLSAMAQSMTTSTTTTVTDDNKIRMQIQNDLNAFTTALDKFAIEIEASKKLNILNDESRLQL